jgi:hypothetical protein
LKLRWQPTIAVLFRPDEAEKTMKTTGFFSLQQGRNLSVAVRRLETAGKWRSDERESVAGERREMLWVMLRYERVYGTPVPLNTFHRWISDETIGWL